MNEHQPSPPAQLAAHRTADLMRQVILAAMPAALISTWYFGYGVVLNLVVAICFAYALEASALYVRRRPIKHHLADNSVLVTAMLFALSVPPGIPWWMIALGTGFAVLLAKQVFGGLGQNPFNPAMAGYLFLLLAFPLEMTAWHVSETVIDPASGHSVLGLTSFREQLELLFPGLIFSSFDIDGLVMATPLIESKLASQSALMSAWSEGRSLLARGSGTGWEWINVAYLLGGIYLIVKRIITWHIPMSILSTVLGWSLFFYSPEQSAIVGTPYLHLFGSATMIGAFFIATDPVSAPTSNPARVVYGIIIGSCIYGVRVWGSYLDAIAIAVIFGNFLAPLLDHVLRPRIFGQISHSRAAPASLGQASIENTVHE